MLLLELFFPLLFLVVALVLSECAPFLSAMCELEVVVLVVSLLFAQEARNATPIKATIEERMDFFIEL